MHTAESLVEVEPLQVRVAERDVDQVHQCVELLLLVTRSNGIAVLVQLFLQKADAKLAHRLRQPLELEG